MSKGPVTHASSEAVHRSPGSAREPRGASEGRERGGSFWRELPVLVVVAFAIAIVVKSFLVQAFYIPSSSMVPTLRQGDRVLVEKVSYRIGGPERGEVVVFQRDIGSVLGVRGAARGASLTDDLGNSIRELFGLPTGGAQDFIKRVIAVEGDEVEGRDGRVYVNGRPVTEPYLAPGTKTSTFGPVAVPPGEIFVMGDNRANSDDSRNFGTVPQNAVVGHAFLLMWPPGDVATL